MVKSKKNRKKKITPRTDYFCQENIQYIDYKDRSTLQKFINRQGRIIPQGYSQLLRKHQKQLTTAIKRARQMALLPYKIIEQNIEHNK